MTLLADIRQLDHLCRSQGVTLPQVVAWAARAGFGVEAKLTASGDEEQLEPQSLAEVLEQMTKLAAAIAALTTSVGSITSRLDAAEAYVRGVPDLVSKAVADALANVGVNDDAAAAEVDAARATIEKETNDVLSAIAENTATPTVPGTSDQGSGVLATNDPAAPPVVAAVEEPAPASEPPATEAPTAEAPTGAGTEEPTN